MYYVNGKISLSSTKKYSTFKYKLQQATLWPRSSCFIAFTYKQSNTCLCRSTIYKAYGGFKYHCFEFVTVPVFVRSEWSLFGIVELCRRTLQDCFKAPQNLRQFSSHQKGQLHNLLNFNQKGWLLQMVQLAKLPQDTTCSPATHNLLSPLLSTASPPAGDRNIKAVPTPHWAEDILLPKPREGRRIKTRIAPQL